MVILWVRDASQDPPPATQPWVGDPVLVTVQIRTGMIGAQPVYPSASNPFQFTQDTSSSGL
jgi:hypothetical protein